MHERNVNFLIALTVVLFPLIFLTLRYISWTSAPYTHTHWEVIKLQFICSIMDSSADFTQKAAVFVWSLAAVCGCDFCYCSLWFDDVICFLWCFFLHLMVSTAAAELLITHFSWVHLSCGWSHPASQTLWVCKGVRVWLKAETKKSWLNIHKSKYNFLSFFWTCSCSTLVK